MCFFKKLFGKKKAKKQEAKDEKVFCECELIDEEKADESAPVVEEKPIEDVQEVQEQNEEIAVEKPVEEVEEVQEQQIEEEQVEEVQEQVVNEPVEEVEEAQEETVVESTEEVQEEPANVWAPVNVEPVETKEEVKPEPKKTKKTPAKKVVKETKVEEVKDEVKDNDKKYTTPLTADDKLLVEGNPDFPHGKFVIKKTDKGNFVYKLFSYNHRVVCIGGEQYKSQVTCKNGINSVMNNCVDAAIEDQTLRNWEEQKCPKWQIYKDKQELFRFRLLATNGQSIATTNDGYSSKDSAKRGIEAIKRASNGADIIRNDVLW